MSFISIKMQQTSIMRNTVKRETISASEPAISVFCHQWKEYFTTWDILTLNSCFLLHSIQWQFYIWAHIGELQWMWEWRFKFVNHINLSGSVKFLQSWLMQGKKTIIKPHLTDSQRMLGANVSCCRVRSKSGPKSSFDTLSLSVCSGHSMWLIDPGDVKLFTCQKYFK